jgi:hypothetical protein
LWACWLDPTEGTELVPLSEFHGSIDVLWSDSPFPAGPIADSFQVFVELDQALASGACLRLGSDMQASLGGHTLFLDEPGSTQGPFAPNTCTQPFFAMTLSRADLDGSDGTLTLRQGSTVIGLALLRFFAPREIETATPARRPLGSTFSVAWSSGVEWAPGSTPDGVPHRADAILYARSDPDPEHGMYLTVTTDGTGSTIALPAGVAPGAYRLRVVSYPFLPHGDCPPATCSTSAEVGRYFDLTLD